MNSETTQDNLVSIITPTFNRADFLPEAIESVLTQTYKNWEMIIVDDGSTDNTDQVVNTYCQRNNKIHFFQQENQGVSKARNTAIEKASGKYLAFLDSDDIYFPNALQNLVNAITAAPTNVKLVYGDFEVFSTLENYRKTITATPPLPRPKLYFQFLISGANPIIPSASITEKKSIVEAGMFDVAYLTNDDTELWTRLIEHYDIAKVDSKIVQYRKHEHQLTQLIGLRRYYRDRLALKFFKSLSLNDLFPNVDSDFEMAIRLDSLAKDMLDRKKFGLQTAMEYTTDDTALYILKLAQKKYYRKKRERFIKKVEEDTPAYLKIKFNCELRLSPEEIDV